MRSKKERKRDFNAKTKKEIMEVKPQF